jgi:hypothetical protein
MRNNQPIIIGISGKIGSGKDTLADLIIKNDPAFIKVSYASKLKKVGAFLTGTEESLWFTQEGKNVSLPEWGMTIGQFQQKLGTEAIRNGLHNEAWILALFADLKENSKWIIPDMRFPNELEAVKQKGGFTIRINGDPAKVRANSTRDLTHLSEIALDNATDFDFVYTNDKTLVELENFAKLILQCANQAW